MLKNTDKSSSSFPSSSLLSFLCPVLPFLFFLLYSLQMFIVDVKKPLFRDTKYFLTFIVEIKQILCRIFVLFQKECYKFFCLWNFIFFFRHMQQKYDSFVLSTRILLVVYYWKKYTVFLQENKTHENNLLFMNIFFPKWA